MAIQSHLKDIISDAAARAEPLAYPYPKHFDDIEAAKAYVESICKKKDFKYSDVLTLSFEQKEYIKDKVHFVVAAKAFEQGQFYLKEAMEDRNALRASIEADIHRILSLVIKPSDWPRIFLDAQAAKHFVSRACAVKNFTYTDFPNVEKGKYKGYVEFNTARHAFEAGFYQTKDQPPKGWMHKHRFIANRAKSGIQKRLPVMRVVAGSGNSGGGVFKAGGGGGGATMVKAGGSAATAMVKSGGIATTAAAMVNAGSGGVAAAVILKNGGTYATLREAITADVERLTALIPVWPLFFTSLNAARDHVATISRNKHFRYTYWPILEPYRFRMFVNFNTAKRALKHGAFSLVEEVGVKEGREEWAAAVRTSDNKAKSEGEVTDEEDDGYGNSDEMEIELEKVEFEDDEEDHVVAATAVEEPANLIDDDDTDRDSDAASISRFDELEDRVQNVQAQVDVVHKEKEDPFKSLIGLARRASTLKSAFG
ncbi:hypothetical protein PTMSG1_06419 [Pyrenophora teres f. maculata]|nr:hypothetical protein PTMSG1_06419 [Pyrenophora teres f. maculata]